MKRRHSVTLILFFSIIGLAACIFWHDKSLASTTVNIASSTSSPDAPLLITTDHPARHTFTFRVAWSGKVEPQNSVAITALRAGRVEVINAEDQHHLEKDQLVMQLGGPQVENARTKITAEIEALGTQVALARHTVERMEESLKAQLATKDQVSAAQEKLISLETQLRDVRLSLKTLNEQTHIIAPMNGIFTHRRVSVGQDVSAGQVVGDIIDTSHLRIEASLFPLQGAAIQGKEATVRLDENQTLTGIIRNVLPEASSTGATMVWIEGSQIDSQLRPGQMVGGDIVVESKPDALAVPESAIVYDSQEHPLLFISKESTYEPLRIQVGLTQDGWVEVTSGLKQEQLVVIQGAYELFYRRFNEQFKVQD